MLRQHIWRALWIAAVMAGLSDAPARAEPPAGAAFIADGNQYRFETSLLSGQLRDKGKAIGLTPVLDQVTKANLAGTYGIFSHYRLLDDQARYGKAAWEWSSQARLLSDGAVEVTWSVDGEHPLDMQAVYRWRAPGTLDLRTTVTAKKQLKGFEVFLASYFKGFDSSAVYAKDKAGPRFVVAVKETGTWQVFPRDAAALALVNDGRWKRPPNPVEWVAMPELAAPLAIRRDKASGLCAVLMAPPGDCFAVCTPYGEENHRSVYLSLFGRNFVAGESAMARSRIIIGRDISDQRAVELFGEYVKEVGGK